MKKKYMKPSCKVYKLTNRTHLLAGSQPNGQPTDDWLNYAPGINSEIMNKKA